MNCLAISYYPDDVWNWNFAVRAIDWSIYLDVDTDLVDETRVANGADCVQLHMASNIRTITV